MFTTLFLFLHLGCNTQKAPSITPPVQPEITSSNTDLIRLFSMRDNGPDCTSLGEVNEQLQQDLVYIVDQVKRPPWAGMRAAQCLIDLYPLQAQPQFQRWMEAKNTKGLALLLSTQLDKLDKEVARKVAEWGQKGPHSALVKPRLQQWVQKQAKQEDSTTK